VRLFCCLNEWGGSAGVKRVRREVRNRRVAEARGSMVVEWAPNVWEEPAPFDRDTEDVCSNLWENRYWRCC
jgi:hypothetical protein